MTNRLNCVLVHIYISTCAVSVPLFVNNNDKMSVECLKFIIEYMRITLKMHESSKCIRKLKCRDCSNKPMICDFIEFSLLAPLLFQLFRSIRNLKRFNTLLLYWPQILHSFVRTNGKYVCLAFGLPFDWNGMEKSLSFAHSQIKASGFPSFFLIFSCVNYFKLIKTKFAYCQQ